MQYIRDFTNSKGTRYVRSKNAVGAQFKDYWIHFQKLPDGQWHVAFHTPATDTTEQFIVEAMDGCSMPPILVLHTSLYFYREIILNEVVPQGATMH